ncbi:hypothetical protein EN766_01970 [Mesorhizobium sp. M2A.F.Ca.ET.046.02.1.1]|nr:hypothetical protein EN766_01970 [Mesorhizobium sp. M2A.F.Ca.ET.046.02.1.1]
MSSRTRVFIAETAVTPHLGVIVLGEDPASHIYGRSKARAAERTRSSISSPDSTKDGRNAWPSR